MHSPFSVQLTTKLTQKQADDIRSLIACCQKRDRISLSYPLAEEDGPVTHYWMTDSQGRLLSVLSLCYWEEHLAECTAFTHPDFRRRGCFSQLLQTALEVCDEDDLLFPVSGNCADTMATLHALDAQIQSQEYEMAYELTKGNAEILSRQEKEAVLEVPNDIFSENARWTLFKPQLSFLPVGSCQTSPAAPDCLCLHHVRIRPDVRRQGLGFSLICQLLSYLRQREIRRVILQVSGQNQAALALYKKTGFQITETLSYWLL